jgi:hypothetical protein
MVQEAKVNINIASLFTGKKAFKEADTTISKLTKNVKNLAAAAGIAFSARAVFNFAKASAKASLEASAQQQRLAQLLSVTNDASAAQVAVLTKQAEALQRIGVVSKNSITQVQSQLATFDLSISSIETLTPAILDYVTAEKGATASASDFKAMTNGLAQALNGNFASLTRTGFVLDEVTKKTISTGTESKRAAAIVKVLNSTYKGFNESLARTPSGQMALLANASDDVRVIIGDGIVTALSMLSDGNIVKLTDAMRDLAEETSTSIIGVGVVAGVVTDRLKTISRQIEKDLNDNIPLLTIREGDFDFKAVFAPIFSALDIIGTKAIENRQLLREMISYPDPQSGRKLDIQLKAKYKADRAANAAMRKFEKERLTIEKKRTRELKARAAIEKANRALEFAGTIFDLDKIQLYAALQGRITDEDRDRLNLKLLLLNAENQTGEALNKSAQEATLLSQKILMNNGLVMTYDGLIKNLAKAKNPFEGFDDYLQDLLNKLRDIQLAMNNINSMGRATPPINYGYTRANPSFTYDPFPPLSNKGNAPTDYGYTASNPSFVYGSGNPMFGADVGTNNGSWNGFSGTPFGQAASSGSTTNVVNLNANWIANPQEVQDAVQNALQNANRAGNSTNYAGGIF